MAIVVAHTPYDALFNLATQAGQAQAAQVEQERRDRKQLLQMQLGVQQENQRFAIAAEQQARQEEMQYQMAMVQAKRQIDLQIETANYARQKQMLTQTLNMIKDSNEFDEQEKQQLSIEVMSKYSGLGSGISPSSFGGKTSGMSDFLQKGAYKMSLANQLQAMVDQGALDPDSAKQAAASFGLSGAFETPEERQSKAADEAVKRYDRVQDTMNSAFDFNEKGQPLDPDSGEKINQDDPRYEYYKTLKAQQDTAKKELDKLQSAGTRRASKAVFAEALQKSRALQQMVQIYGPEAAFEKWNQTFGGENPIEGKPQRYGKFEQMKKVITGFGGQADVLSNLYQTRGQ